MIRPLLLYCCFGAVVAAQLDPLYGAIALVVIFFVDLLTQNTPET
jgi:hypothetical protein